MQPEAWHTAPLQPVSRHGSAGAAILRFAASAAGIAALLFAYYAYTWRSLAGFQYAIDTCRELFCDFASFYYPMGQTVLRTGVPATGFVYSPFIAILLAAFAKWGFSTSLVAWGTLQALSIVLYLLLFRRLVPAGLGLQLLFVFVTLSSFPLLHVLTWGQVGVFTTVALLAMMVLLERDHRAAAAALFAFAVSFKFFPLIFLAPFVVRRDSRFLVYAAAFGAAFLILVPLLFLGASGTLGFYSGLIDSYRASEWIVSNYNSQHLPHVILRLASAGGSDLQAWLPLLTGISYAIAAANLGLLFLVQYERLAHADLWSFLLLFLSVPLVLKTSWPVDLVYLPFAQVLLLWRLVEGETAKTERPPADAARVQGFSVRRVSALLLVLASILISNVVFFNLYGDRFHYGFYGFIFWANLLVLIASYMELLPPVLTRMRMPPATAMPAVPASS